MTSRAFTSLTASPARDWVAVASIDGDIWLWHADDDPPRLIGQHTGAIHGLSFDDTGMRLISGGEDAMLKVWEVRTGQELLSHRVVGPHLSAVAFGADRIGVGLQREALLLPIDVPSGAGRERITARNAAASYVEGLVREIGAIEDVQAYIETDARLTDRFRVEAHQAARQRGDNPHQLQQFLWDHVVKHTDLHQSEYCTAVTRLREVIQRDPNNMSWLNTFGAALYRCGELSEAEETLERTVAQRRDRNDLVFLAMTKVGLGKLTEARRLRDELVAGWPAAPSPGDPDFAFIAELEKLLESAGGPTSTP